MLTKEIVEKAIGENVTLMGDDFIGFKFVGENASFYNKLLISVYENGEDVTEILNESWLEENDIPTAEYELKTWIEEQTL